MTHYEYDQVFIQAAEQGIDLPGFKELERGGIVGQALLVDCVTEDLSPWFFGEYGFVITDARPLPFQPCNGRLNFFTPAA